MSQRPTAHASAPVLPTVWPGNISFGISLPDRLSSSCAGAEAALTAGVCYPHDQGEHKSYQHSSVDDVRAPDGSETRPEAREHAGIRRISLFTSRMRLRPDEVLSRRRMFAGVARVTSGRQTHVTRSRHTLFALGPSKMRRSTDLMLLSSYIIVPKSEIRAKFFSAFSHNNSRRRYFRAAHGRHKILEAIPPRTVGTPFAFCAQVEVQRSEVAKDGKSKEETRKCVGDEE